MNLDQSCHRRDIVSAFGARHCHTQLHDERIMTVRVSDPVVQSVVGKDREYHSGRALALCFVKLALGGLFPAD